MTLLYVASEQRGAGKTAFCAAFARHLEQHGHRATVIKPLGDADDGDDTIYRELLGQPSGEAPRPLPDGALTPELLEEIKASADRATDGHDVVLVEGASELTTTDSLQLADALDMRVVVVAGFEPGLDAGRLSRWSTLFGDRLLGYVINGLTPYLARDVTTTLLPSMEAEGLVSMGIIPEERTLLGVSVGQLASHLNGRYIVGEDLANGLVEHFLVGGLGMDSGLAYFALREHKAVIVRGDRPDIQMAALQTPTTCLLLTKGTEPIEYVVNEAELEDVPIVVVESDTIDTMERVGAMQDSVSFDHPAKLERYTALVEEHVDLGAVREALGLAA